MPATQIENQQVIEAVISGPDGANGLYTCTGKVRVNMELTPDQRKRETFTFLVGQQFSPGQFRRGIASASVAGFSANVDPNVNGWHYWEIQSVEADWDDESGQTEVRVELELATGPGTLVVMTAIAVTATVLAET